MTMQIWKYELPRPSSNELTYYIPEEAQILDYQIQNGAFVFWALVYPDRTPTQRWFYHIGTDWDIPCTDVEYIGTVQEGKYTWHLVEVIF